MNAEVICLTSSSSSSSDEDDPSSSHRCRVVRVASVNKSAAAAAAAAAAAVAHGREKRRSSLAEPELDLEPTGASNIRTEQRTEPELDAAGPSHIKTRNAQNTLSAQPGISSQTAVVKPQLVAHTKILIPPSDEDVFRNFVKVCLKRRDDKDTKQVLLKLEKLYSKLSTIQRQDNEFRLLISNCHNMISKSLAKDIYTPILELRTEIKRLIKTAAVVEQQQQQNGEQQQQETCDEKQLSGGDVKRIELLENSIAKCLKKIKKLEEKEVDFDDDDNSVYIQEDKYKKKLIQLYNALSKVSGDKDLKRQLLKKKIKRKDISDEMTGIPLVDNAILNLINFDISKINQFKHLESTLRCADHIKMPDYTDILKCIDQCSKDSNLDLRKEKMEKLAKRAFTTVGNFLKKKRTNETECYFQSFLNEETGGQDPAKKDAELCKKLSENKKKGDKKLEEIFEKYVDLQKGLSQEDMEKQQQVSSDTEDGQNSSSSSSSIESKESSKQQDGTKKSVGPKSKIISSSDVDDNENEESAQIFKCPATADGNDVHYDNDLLDITDIGPPTARDPLDDNQVSSPAVETKKLPQSNEILIVESSPRPVFYEAKSCTATTIKAAQRNVSPPPRNEPVAAAVDTASKENAGEPTQGSCCPPTNKRPFIKVCAFAKPPPAWGGLSGPSSPEKARKTFKPREADSPFTKRRRSSSPECIDLTKREREKQLTPRSPSIAARSINPLANVKRTTSSPAATAAAAAASSLSQPAKRVVIVKNVINNFHVPLSDASAAAAAAAGPRGKNIFHPSRSSSSILSKHSRRDTVWLSKDNKK